MADTDTTAGSETATASTDEETDSTKITLDDTELTLSLPANADSDEAAAIASVVGAHLHDRHVAATAAAASDEPDKADAWTVAGRLKAMGKRRWPERIRRGEEWKAAARSFY